MYTRRKKLRQQTEQNTISSMCGTKEMMEEEKKYKNYEKRVPTIVCMTALFDNN